MQSDERGAQVIRLHADTFTQPEQLGPVECDGSYTCACVRCAPATLRAVERGIRPRSRSGIPVKVRRAA